MRALIARAKRSKYVWCCSAWESEQVTLAHAVVRHMGNYRNAGFAMFSF